MRKFAFVALLLVGLAGCATSPYGNFTQNSPAAYDHKMADDAVAQLIAVYPPASTRFDLLQPAPDAFGVSLVESLRANGYALLEFKPEASRQGGAAANAATATPTGAGLPLRYVLDQAPGSNLYRVTLLVGSQSLTRAYTTQDGSVYAAGAWVRKE